MKSLHLVIAIAVALTPARALAGPKATPTRDDLIAHAVERFDADDFDGALRDFEAAYLLEHRPVDLFNIGRVHEAAGRPQQARSYYQRFLAFAELSAAERKTGEERLASLPPPPAKVVPTGKDRSARRATHRDRDREPRVARWAAATGGTLIPIGLGGLAAGTTLAIAAERNAENARKSSDAATPIEETPHYRLAKKEALAADILLIAGGVLTATGIVVILAGADRKQARAQRRVSASPAGAGMSVRVRF